METAYITLTDVANIATFVAPGYFAVRLYGAVYARQSSELSRLLVESVVFSLPIIAATNWIWTVCGQVVPSSATWPYTLTAVGVAVLVGGIAAELRAQWPLLVIARRLGLGEPDDDFIRAQFAKVPKGHPVIVTLQDGKIFSGEPRTGNKAAGQGREYYFENIAWYNEETGEWDERPGGLILSLNEVQYIETPGTTRAQKLAQENNGRRPTKK